MCVQECKTKFLISKFWIEKLKTCLELCTLHSGGQILLGLTFVQRVHQHTGRRQTCDVDNGGRFSQYIHGDSIHSWECIQNTMNDRYFTCAAHAIHLHGLKKIKIMVNISQEVHRHMCKKHKKTKK